MCPAIHNPASCEIRTVFRFLHAKNMNAVEIHRELCPADYGQNVTSEETVCQDVHDEARSGGPSVASDDQNISERLRLTISELSCEFPQISITVLCEVFTVRLGYHKLCAMCVPKLLTDAHRPQIIALALASLERHHKNGDEHPNTQVANTGFAGHLNLHHQKIRVVIITIKLGTINIFKF
ncbi:hypothetical protein B7P43_G01536 [Cryptotermes secundus]|uniref:Uncharacterized protein n=1 Tax=Cryptotermes secundus TaxID=105785 RepID=A0A2J7PF48_9NEOP|nr:hypothetical protein B7P43_G01536 [Cryptotermes secundus]